MRAKSRHLWSLFSIGCLAVLAAGCSSPTGEVGDAAEQAETSEAPTEETAAPTEGAESPQRGEAGEAVLTIGDDLYTAELSLCLLAPDDAVFYGPAYDESGNHVGQLDGDFTVYEGDAIGGARIDFGATERFQTSDDFVTIGDAVGALVFTVFTDSEWVVLGTAYDQDFKQTPGAQLVVTC